MQNYDLDWKNNILPKWNEYMLSLMKQSQTEAPIAGFKSNIELSPHYESGWVKLLYCSYHAMDY